MIDRKLLPAYFMLAALAACSSAPTALPTPSPSQTSAPAPIRVNLTVEPVVSADGTLTIHAESNLPDGTELLGSVRQTKGGSGRPYQGGETKTLSGGEADFGPYSQRGNELPAGTYEVSVTMPVAVNQPEAVKKLIGEHGENLTGPLVTQAFGNATVSVEKTVTIK